MSSGAESMFLGIRLDVDATGAVSGINQTSRAMDGLKQKTRATGQEVSTDTQKTLQNAGKLGAAAMVGGIAAVAGGEVLRRNLLNPMIEEAASFEVEMSQLRFVSGAVGDELARIKKFVINVGLETQFDPQQAAEGLRRLRAAGLTTQQAMDSLRAALDLATGSAGEIGLGKAAETSAAALKKFGENAKDIRHITDAFADATRRTNLQVKDLPIVLRSAGDAIQKLNMDPGQFFAVTGSLKNMGLTAAQSGNAVQGFARRMALITKQVDKYGRRTKKMTGEAPAVVAAFEKLGVKFFDQNEQLRDATDLFEEFSAAIANVKSEQQRLVLVQTLFGTQSGKILGSIGAMDKAAMESGLSFRGLVEALNSAGGASREMAAAFENTLSGMEIFVQGTKQTILIILGETLLPVLKRILDVSKAVLGSFLNLIQQNPMLAKAFSIMIVLTTGLLLTFGALLLIVGALSMAMGPLVIGIQAAGGMTAAWAAATLLLETVLTPLLLIVLAVTAAILLFAAVVVGMVKMFQTNFGGFRDFLGGIGSDIKAVWGALTEWFANDGSISQALGDELKDRGLLGAFTTIVKMAARLQAVWEGFTTAIGFTIKLLEPAFTFIFNALEFVFRAFGRVVEQFTSILADSAIDAWKVLGYVIAGPVVAAIVSFTLALTALAAVGTVVAVIFLVILAVVGTVVFGIIWLIAKIVEGIVWFFTTLTEIGTAVGLFMSDLINGAPGYGENFVTAFKEGMAAAWVDLKAWFWKSLGELREMLPFSDAQVGPLSTLTLAGRSLVSTLELGMGLEFPSLLDSVASGAGAIMDALGFSEEGDPLSTAPTIDPETGLAIPEAATGEGASAAAIQVGDITMTVQVMEATEEEAERLSEMVIKKIQDGLVTLQEAEFA